MTVKITTGEMLDLDDLPSLTLWIRDHIEVTDTQIVDYDDGSGICLGCNIAGVQDLGLAYKGSGFDLAVYVDLVDDADCGQSETAAGERP